MQLNQFKFLLAVDQHGSISRAAQELYISQSTISLSLINLEEELGYVLLNRSKRGVTLTPQGKEVLKRAQIIQDAIDSLKEISADDEKIIGDVRIGGNSHFAMNLITDTMLQLKNRYDGIHIHAERDRIKEVLKKVAQNELDLAFVHFNELGALDVENDLKRLQLEFNQTFTNRLCVCTRPDHPLQQQASVRFSDVMAYERVTMAQQADKFLMQHFGYPKRHANVITLGDIMNLRKYAAHTDAVVILPENEARRSNREYTYQLEPLAVADFDVAIYGGWVHHATHEMNAAEKCVVEALEDLCQQYIEIETE